MKLTFKQKNTIRLIGLLVVLSGILIFIYFELRDEDNIDMNDLQKKMTDNEKQSIRNNVNEAGGLQIQQYAANGALKNNGKITINEIAKIQSLNNE